jgi:hypothetical protein
LFKLILFLNLDRLLVDGQPARFQVRLRLTGMLNGRIDLPVMPDEVGFFCARHMLSPSLCALLNALNREARENPGLQIQIGSDT